MFEIVRYHLNFSSLSRLFLRPKAPPSRKDRLTMWLEQLQYDETTGEEETAAKLHSHFCYCVEQRIATVLEHVGSLLPLEAIPDPGWKHWAFAIASKVTQPRKLTPGRGGSSTPRDGLSSAQGFPRCTTSGYGNGVCSVGVGAHIDAEVACKSKQIPRNIPQNTRRRQRCFQQKSDGVSRRSQQRINGIYLGIPR